MGFRKFPEKKTDKEIINVKTMKERNNSDKIWMIGVPYKK